MEFLARGLRRQAAQGGVQTRGSLLTERGEAFRQKRGWATYPGNRQAGQSRPDRSRIPGASHGPLLIPHCRVHTGPVKDGRTPTTEGLLKDIQRPQVAQPRDAFSQPRRDPRPLKELRIGLEAPQMSPEAMHRLVTEGWLLERPCEHNRPGPHRRDALFDGVPPHQRNGGSPDSPLPRWPQWNAWKINLVPYATNPAPGNVNSHAETIRIVTPHRTAESRVTAPTPMIDDVMVCVVLTGMPKCAVPSRIKAALVSAANPWTGSILTMRIPNVLMMRHPPAAVPKPIATAHERRTQVGTATWSRCPADTSASVMIPIAFCASFAP